MSRARVLKPEFFSDSSVVRCTPLARLLYAGSWVFADDNGIFPDDMLQLKMQALPGDNVDCEALKCEIVNAGLWLPYVADGRRWILVRTFHKHQNLDRPTPIYPLPDADTLADFGLSVVERTYSRHDKTLSVRVLVGVQSSNGRRPVGDQAASSRRTDAERSADGRLEKNRIEDEKKKNTYMSDFLDEWNRLPDGFSRINRLGARTAALMTRMKEPWWRDNWKAAIKKMSEIPGLAGGNDSGWKASAEWFLKPDTVSKILEGKYDNWGTKKQQNDELPFSKTEW